MLEAYRQHTADRAAQGIVPKPLSAQQVNELTDLLKAPPLGEEKFLLDLLSKLKILQKILQKNYLLEQ